MRRIFEFKLRFTLPFSCRGLNFIRLNDSAIRATDMDQVFSVCINLPLQPIAPNGKIEIWFPSYDTVYIALFQADFRFFERKIQIAILSGLLPVQHTRYKDT